MNAEEIAKMRETYDRLENKRFRIKHPDRVDTMNTRDDVFIKRNIQPLFQPDLESESISTLRVTNIVDLIARDISFQFISFDDLYEVGELLEEYMEQVHKIGINNFKSDPKAYQVIQNVNKAKKILSTLAKERKLAEQKKNGTYKPSIMDILKDIL